MLAWPTLDARWSRPSVQSFEKNPCVETYENMTNVRNNVWWSQNTRLVQRKTKRTILGRVNFAPRVGPLRNCHG